MRRGSLPPLLRAAFPMAVCLAVCGQTVETMDLHKAIQQGRVKAEITGSGITTVSVKVTRTKASKPLRVRVPLGTLFVAGSGDAQNMVGTAAEVVDLTTATATEISVSAACANLHLDVPDSDVNFSVEEGPAQEDLKKVLPLLRTASASDEVTQAAVWMVSDDADYDDLGTLVISYGGLGFGGSRAINERDAAHAMMLLERAKVDVREKAIWDDRVPVCEEVAGTTESAATWCSALLRDTTDLAWRLESLDSEKRAVRNIARTTLAKESSAEALPKLLEAFPTLKGDAAAAVARALGNYGAPEAVEVLSKAIESADRPVQLAAAEILSKSETLIAGPPPKPCWPSYGPARPRPSRLPQSPPLGWPPLRSSARLRCP